MVDITKIPAHELMQDKFESLFDIQTCEAALRVGIERYSAGSVQERLEINQKIVEKINAELNRRLGLGKGEVGDGI